MPEQQNGDGMPEAPGSLKMSAMVPAMENDPPFIVIQSSEVVGLTVLNVGNHRAVVSTIDLSEAIQRCDLRHAKEELYKTDHSG